ncbi:uncharacterized protein BDV17DRAFT_296617 [Aspergillus undulatus]|uniref:uncharacterized protein n=1 Tax=Aspergillus undulatus TaxID=1810928 RepID=UPI003CCD79BD
MDLSSMIEDMMEGGLVFHPSNCVNGVVEFYLLNWVRELRDEPLLDKTDHHDYQSWLEEPYSIGYLMFYLSIGHHENQALTLSKRLLPRRWIKKSIFNAKNEITREFGSQSQPQLRADRVVKLDGDDVAARFDSSEAGLSYLIANHPDQLELLDTPEVIEGLGTAQE